MPVGEKYTFVHFHCRGCGSMRDGLSKVAKDYRRAAINRYEEAMLLYAAGKCTGAMYLAGYAVECVLKVLVLSTVPVAQQAEYAKNEFRGHAGHDFESLRAAYLVRLGGGVPSDVAKRFALVRDWSTDLRYDPRESKDDEADPFLKAVEDIITWAEGRV